MNAPSTVTDQALAAFVKYACRERDIDRTEAMLKAVYTNPTQAANVQLARIANLAKLHLEAKARSSA